MNQAAPAAIAPKNKSPINPPITSPALERFFGAGADSAVAATAGPLSTTADSTGGGDETAAGVSKNSGVGGSEAAIASLTSMRGTVAAGSNTGVGA